MKVMIVDDHALCREAIARVLLGLSEDIRVCKVASVAAGLDCAATCGDVDLVLLDLKQLDATWLEGMRALRARFPECPIVVTTALDDPENVQRVLEQGAQGYIHKSSLPEALLTTLRRVLAGEVGVAAPWTLDLPASPPSLPALTQRQREVLALLCAGLSNKEIARKLAMSDNTVRVHLAAVFRALGVSTRTQAALLARQAGLA